MPDVPPPIRPFSVRTHLQPRAWGGSRFPSVDGQAVGEAWLVADRCEIADGPYAGRTLGELTAEAGSRLVGSAAGDRAGGHFPLLIKILDAAEWLSVQVHPDTAVARQRHGPGAVGKEEAWLVLDAPPGAELVAGLRPGTTRGQLEAAFGTPEVRDLLDRLRVRRGDAVTVPAGVVHSIPPGVSVYEIQEPSDLTYRLYDWDRPASLGRSLDRDASLAAVQVDGRPRVARAPESPGTVERIATSDAFLLRCARTDQNAPVDVEIDERSVVVVTGVEGRATVLWRADDGEAIERSLGSTEGVIVPAARARLRVSSAEAATIVFGSMV